MPKICEVSKGAISFSEGLFAHKEFAVIIHRDDTPQGNYPEAKFFLKSHRLDFRLTTKIMTQGAHDSPRKD